MKVFLTSFGVLAVLGIAWFAQDVRASGTFWQGIPMLIALSPFVLSIAGVGALLITLLFSIVELVRGVERSSDVEIERERLIWCPLIGVLLGGAAATAAVLVSPWLDWVPYEYKRDPGIWVVVFVCVAALTTFALRRAQREGNRR